MPLSFTLDTVGPLARTAEDCAIILSIIAGPDPLDPTTVMAPKWDAKAMKRPAKGLTIGIPKRFYVDDLEPDVAKAMDDAKAEFKKLGVKIVEVDLPDQVLVSAAAMIVLAVEAATYHAPWLRARPDDYGTQVRNRLQNGLAYSAIEYLEALRWRAHALQAHLAAIGKCDAVVPPVSALRADYCRNVVGGAVNAECNHPGRQALHAADQHSVPRCRAVLAWPSRSADRAAVYRAPVQHETVAALGVAFQSATDHHTVPNLTTDRRMQDLRLRFHGRANGACAQFRRLHAQSESCSACWGSGSGRA